MAIARPPPPVSLSVSDLQQQRLHVFVLSVVDGQPIRRMPVYGEAVLSIPNRYYDTSDVFSREVAHGSQHLHLKKHFQPIQSANKFVEKALLHAVTKRVDLHGLALVNDLGPWEKFLGLTKRGIEDAELLSSNDQPPTGFEETVDGIVDSAATEAGLDSASATLNIATIAMGCLSTDHTGFVSFDLTRLKSLIPAGIRELRLTVTFYMSHNITSTNRVPITAQNASLGTMSIVSRIAIDPSKSPSHPALALPSLQNPSLLDWQTSPGSFTSVPGSLIGADGCETFTPANFATYTFPLRQLHRLIDTGESAVKPVSSNFSAALVIEYKVTLTPIGHSLGEISYSLPLAPGESVRLAIIDWRHDASTNRTEDTKFTEGLLHDQARDRTISETVKAALDEWQHGGSIMGGASAGAGGAASSGAYGASAGGAASIGGAYTTSSGSRDLSAETLQKIADAVHQASAATRELVSTVVVQTDEEESENIKTRSFSNNNRAHTMTVLYYQILRHYHLQVGFSRAYEAVLVPRDRFFWINGDVGSESWSIDRDDFLIAKQYLLRPALLDQSLAPAFDALQRLAEQRGKLELNPVAAWEGDKEIIRLKMDFSVSKHSPDVLNGYIITLTSSDLKLTWMNDSSHPAGDDMNAGALGKRFDQEDTSFTLVTTDLDPPIKWKDLKQVYFVIRGGNSLETQLGNVEGVFVDDSGNGSVVLLPEPGQALSFATAGVRVDVALTTRPPAPPPAGPSAESIISSADYNLIKMLKYHIFLERDYYFRVLDFVVPF